MRDEPDGSWLVAGPYELRSSLRRPAEWQLTLFACPTSELVPDVDGSQLYRVDLRTWSRPVPALIVNQRGEIVDRGSRSPAEIYQGSNTPIGLIRPADPGSWLYPQVDTYGGQARFVRLPGGPVPAESAVPALLAGIDQHYARLNNYLRFRMKLLPDVELEHKYTLLDDPDVCVLARQTLAMAAAGGLAGWIVEYREEIQNWDFLNHLYAIEEPAADAGYVAFIPDRNDRYAVKRKIFDADRDERPELRQLGVDIQVDFEAYLRQEMQLTPTWHASFRRIRYDISVESIETGNVFGIAFDRCVIVDEQGRRVSGLAELVQCEIEYIYSQSLEPVTFDFVRQDLAQLRVLVSDYFDECGIANYQRHESKLTFLREQLATRAQPV